MPRNSLTWLWLSGCVYEFISFGTHRFNHKNCLSQDLKSPKSNDHPLLDRSKPFRQSLLKWFHVNSKEYPWRSTTNPYEILVSEMMLQQTQVVTVLGRGYYRRWLESFPDFKSLAAADESEVLRVWEGLGYYSRARNLHKLAQLVVHELENKFPWSF